MFQLPEVTRPIPGWEGLYEVTEDGRVLSLSRIVTSADGRKWVTPTRWLKPLGNGRGYFGVNLHRTGVDKRRWTIHKLVALAWLGQPGPGQTEVNHKDSDRGNNCASNLEWCSRAENTLHGWHHGHIKQTPARRAAYALGHAARRGLKPEQVALVRDRVRAGEQQKSVAQSLGIQRSTVCQIVNGKSYTTY